MNPFAMTGEELLGLYANIPMIQAQRLIESGKLYRGLKAKDHGYVRDIFILAYGDEKRADKARDAFLEEVVNSQTGASQDG